MIDRNQRIAALFGQYIHEQRAAKHWTRAELARMSGVTAQYVSFLERGQNTPTIDTLLRICYAFGSYGWDVLKTIEEKLIAENA
jgi:transcriptional regulator with XRE-family HTH domain